MKGFLEKGFISGLLHSKQLHKIMFSYQGRSNAWMFIDHLDQRNEIDFSRQLLARGRRMVEEGENTFDSFTPIPRGSVFLDRTDNCGPKVLCLP